jgi:hypothetical protein
MSPLALCPGCSRHVKRTDPACPFCAAPLDAVPSAAAFDEESPRISRSAMILAGAAMVAGCNLTQPANIYGGPPPPPAAQDAGQGVAAIYGGPPPMFADAAMAPSPPPAVPAYGAPPPVPPTPPVPPDAGATGHAAHHHATHATPTPPHPMPMPAYGVSPRDPRVP